MNILVTGGTGFVGNHLIRELLTEKANTVYALVRDRKKLEQFDFHSRITVIAGDLFKAEAFPADIEVVFHLAALTKVISPGEFLHCNHLGTMALLDKLQPLKKLRKVVLLSSLAAAGPNRQIPRLREGMPDNPVSLYGRSKLAQEKIIQAHSPAPYIIIRAPIVFGPGDLDMLTIFRVLKKGILPELGRRQRMYSVIYVKDLVKGMIAAANSPCHHGHVATGAGTDQASDADARQPAEHSADARVLIGGDLRLNDLLNHASPDFHLARLRTRCGTGGQRKRDDGSREARAKTVRHGLVLHVLGQKGHQTHGSSRLRDYGTARDDGAPGRLIARAELRCAATATTTSGAHPRRPAHPEGVVAPRPTRPRNA